MLECREFINADEIARGLSPFQPETAAIEAGRIMLARMDHFIDAGQTFAFETTLASRTFQDRLRTAANAGYRVTLIFFWLSSVELACERVRQRTKEGGHSIPEEVIRRRYRRGLVNLFEVYLSLADKAVVIDNSEGSSEIIAVKTGTPDFIPTDHVRFNQLYDEYQRTISR